MTVADARLNLLAGGGGTGGLGLYMYVTDGSDTVADVVEQGYFDNGATTNTGIRDKLRVGDLIFIIQPGSQTVQDPLKQIVDVGLTVVTEVTSAGVINCANDFMGATVSYTA